MNPISATLALKAMDGLLMRQTATAENIANAQTKGYRPLKVSFEAELARAAPRGLAAINDVQPALSRVQADPLGSTLRLDLELADSAMTSGRYGALIEILNRQLQISALATSGGR